MSDQPKPTIGRVILYKTSTDHDNEREIQLQEILPGIVNRVHSDTCIDAMIMWPGAGATPSCIASIPFTADIEAHDVGLDGPAWGWMPYQKAVHAGTIEPTKHA